MSVRPQNKMAGEKRTKDYQLSPKQLEMVTFCFKIVILIT